MTGIGRGVAFSGAIEPARLAYLASRAENLGYESVWVTVLHGTTDVPSVLRSVSGSTRSVSLGLGLIPLPAFDARRIAAAVLDSAPDRTTVVIGAGNVRADSAQQVAEAVQELRQMTDGVAVGVGGYGESLLRLAGVSADAVLVNWSTPAHTQWALQTATSQRPIDPCRPQPRMYVYVPTALGPDARSILDAQLDAMAAQPHHRQHQERWGRSNMGFAAENGRAAEQLLRSFAPHHPVVLPIAPDEQALLRIITELAP